MCVIASLVILVDQVLRAYFFQLSKELSVFVGLIITNCIVLGRAEAYALGNSPWPSFLDGLGNGLGYTLVLCVVAALREILGSGTIWGIALIPQATYDMGYVNMGLMVLPPGAFILLGLYIWLQNTLLGRAGENRGFKIVCRVFWLSHFIYFYKQHTISLLSWYVYFLGMFQED